MPEENKTLLELIALRREFHEHSARSQENHRQFLEHAAGEDEMRKQWEALLAQREADTAARQKLLDGQDSIMQSLEAGHERMDKMQTELTENTAITTAIRDTSTTFKTLRKWLLWIAPVFAGIGAAAYGVWQLIAAIGKAHGSDIGPTP